MATEATPETDDLILVIMPVKDNVDLDVLCARLVYIHGAIHGVSMYKGWMDRMITSRGALRVRADRDVVDAVRHIIATKKHGFTGLQLLTHDGNDGYNLVMQGKAFIGDIVTPSPRATESERASVRHISKYVYVRTDAVADKSDEDYVVMECDTTPKDEPLHYVAKIGDLAIVGGGLDTNTDIPLLRAMLIKNYGDMDGRHQFMEWLDDMYQTHGSIDVRARTNIVQEISRLPAHQFTQNTGLYLLKTDMAGYREVIEHKAHINDAVSPCTFRLCYRENLSTFVHANKADIGPGPRPVIMFESTGLSSPGVHALRAHLFAKTGTNIVFDEWVDNMHASHFSIESRRTPAIIDAITEMEAKKGEFPSILDGICLLHRGDVGYPVLTNETAPGPIYHGALRQLIGKDEAMAGVRAFAPLPGNLDMRKACLYHSPTRGMLVFSSAPGVSVYTGALRDRVDSATGDPRVYSAWLQNLVGHGDTVNGRENQTIIDAVRELHKAYVITGNGVETIHVLDEGTPAYDKVVSGEAHINDALSPCKFYQSSAMRCTELTPHTHERGPLHMRF